MTPEEAIGGFLIAIACGVVLGIAVLILIYKMVDGDLPVGAGLSAMVMIFVAMALAIHPPHPIVPGVVLVLSLALMAFFPYAENVLQEFELRAVDAQRLERCYETIRTRPDNFVARFELASLLHEHGFPAQAIHISATTLQVLDTQRDEVKNRSMRDVFHKEELMLKRWQAAHYDTSAVKCINCGAYNRPTEMFCTGCSRPYLLDKVQGQEIRPRVWAKLILAWAAVALFIPLAAAVGMNLSGPMQMLTFAGALIAVAGLMTWLFRPPKHGRQLYDVLD